MKRSLLFLFIVVGLFFEEPANAQQKQIQFLSGTDAKHTVAWEDK